MTLRRKAATALRRMARRLDPPVSMTTYASTPTTTITSQARWHFQVEKP